MSVGDGESERVCDGRRRGRGALRRRRSLLRGHTLLASSGASARSLFESSSQVVVPPYIPPRRAPRRRRAGPAHTLSLCSLLAGLPRVWRRQYLECRQ
jgi:hypothetical protein